MDWMLEARASQSFVFPSRRRDDAMDALGVSLATGDKIGSDWRWTQWFFFFFRWGGRRGQFSGRNMRLADKALAAEEGGMRWDGHVAGLAICHFFSLRIDAPPLSRESRWRDGREASRQASVVEKGSSSARPGLDFPPFSPFSFPTRRVRAAITALPERSQLCLSQKSFRSRSCSEPPIPRNPLFLGRPVR